MPILKSFIIVLSLSYLLGACMTIDHSHHHAVHHRLIDRAVLFDNPEVAGAQLSPDGRYISFLKAHDGILNIWLKKVDEPFEKAILLTDSKRPLSSYFWTEDGQYILYLRDNDGDENYHLYALDPSQATAEKLPISRNITPFKGARVTLVHMSQIHPDYIWIGLNNRDPAWFDLYRLTISSGKLEKVYQNEDRIVGFEFDWDDQLRILERTDEKGNTEVFKRSADGKLTPLLTVNINDAFSIAGWTPDNSHPYVISNQGDVDLATLYLMDLQTAQRQKVESDPKNHVDIDGVVFNRNTRRMTATSYIDDKPVYYWKDKEREAQYQYLKKQFRGKEVGIVDADNEYQKFLVSTWADKYAGDVYLFEPHAKDPKQKLVYQYTSRPALKKVEFLLSPMQAIHYSSRDGLEIPAYLTLPVNYSKDKKLPLVVLVHGGPKGPRDYWGYDPTVQFLANRGYAVLQPNYRASGGYGKKFLNAGDLQWGKLMQDDITYGVKYLVSKGIIDPKKVVIMGGSYGGYATLAGLAFTPDIYAAGVDIVGPSNLFTLLASIPPYWEAGRAQLYQMTGSPETEEGKKQLYEASPLFSVDKINKPLMIVQGANDPRVNQAESDQIVAALRDKGKKVVYLLAKDEGHGYVKPLNRMAMYAEIEKFLAEILGGTYQKDMPSEVSKTLQQLKVDIASVKVKSKSSSHLQK
ncbi:MAG: S9 family peptidase [Francisella sp.]|nr:MAG: S9 family peptidase [Francisella sp.]